MSEEKQSAAPVQTEQLINHLDKYIRNIVRDEFNRMTWSDLQARFPELVQELRAKFPAQVPDVREQIISGITKIVSASIDDMAKSGLACPSQHF